VGLNSRNQYRKRSGAFSTANPAHDPAQERVWLALGVVLAGVGASCLEPAEGIVGLQKRFPLSGGGGLISALWRGKKSLRSL
jgi:hypothetical protein